MTAEELKLFLSTPLALFVLMLLASLGSAFKQMAVARRGGSGVTASAYFLDHWPETLIMIGGNIAAFLGLIFTDTLNPAAALGFGYLANDSADAWTRQGRSVAIGGSDRQGGFVRPLLLAILLAITVPMVLMLHGCTSIGLQEARTFDERWAYAQGQTTALREVSTRALDAHLITSEDMEYAISMCDRSAQLLSAARAAASAGDVSTAEGRLLLVTSVLAELERYLNSRSQRIEK